MLLKRHHLLTEGLESMGENDDAGANTPDAMPGEVLSE